MIINRPSRGYERTKRDRPEYEGEGRQKQGAGEVNNAQRKQAQSIPLYDPPTALPTLPTTPPTTLAPHPIPGSPASLTVLCLSSPSSPNSSSSLLLRRCLIPLRVSLNLSLELEGLTGKGIEEGRWEGPSEEGPRMRGREEVDCTVRRVRLRVRFGRGSKGWTSAEKGASEGGAFAEGEGDVAMAMVDLTAASLRFAT